MSLTSSELEAKSRAEEYNHNQYDASTNPYGMGGIGYKTAGAAGLEGNWSQSIRDNSVLADAVARMSGEAATSSGTATTQAGNAAASAALAEDWAIDSTISGGSAKEWATRAEDDSIPGGGGLFSSLHYAAKAEDARDLAEDYRDQALAAVTSASMPFTVTAGSSTAYTATITGYTVGDGSTIRISFHTACGNSPTLAVNGGTAYAIVTPDDVALTSGEIATGQNLLIMYDTYINKWVVTGGLEFNKLRQDLNANGHDITGAGSVSATSFTQGGSAVLDAGDVGSSVQAYDADTAKTDVAQNWTAAQDYSATTINARAAAVAVSGTTKTLALTDENTMQECSNGSAQAITVPTNASVAFPTGTWITFEQHGAGTVTITGDTGVSINGTSAGSVEMSDQWGAITLRKIGTDAWIAYGSIA